MPAFGAPKDSRLRAAKWTSMADNPEKPWWLRLDGLPPVKAPPSSSTRIGRWEHAALRRPARFGWGLGVVAGIAWASLFFFIYEASVPTSVLLGAGTAVLWGLPHTAALRARSRRLAADDR